MADLLSSQVRKRKFQQREIDLDQLTDEELQSIYSFDRQSIKYVLEILKDDLQRQTRGNNALSPILAPIFHAIFYLEAGGRNLVEPAFFSTNLGLVYCGIISLSGKTF